MLAELTTEQVNATIHRSSIIEQIVGPFCGLMTGTLAGTTATLQVSPDDGTTWQNTGAADVLTATEPHKPFFAASGGFYRFEIAGTNRASVKIWYGHQDQSNVYQH